MIFHNGGLKTRERLPLSGDSQSLTRPTDNVASLFALVESCHPRESRYTQPLKMQA
jgi:hypothetical protein